MIFLTSSPCMFGFSFNVFIAWESVKLPDADQSVRFFEV